MNYIARVVLVKDDFERENWSFEYLGEGKKDCFYVNDFLKIISNGFPILLFLMCFSFKKRNQMEEITIWDSKKFNRSRCSVEIQQIKLKKYETWKMCAPRNLHCNHHILSEYDSIEKVLIWKIALVSDHLVNFVIYRSIPLKADRVSLTIPANVSHFDVFNFFFLFFLPPSTVCTVASEKRRMGPLSFLFLGPSSA